MDAQTAELDLAGVDLTDLDHFADGPPHEIFARLRAEAPVSWNASADGPGFWSITKAADIEAISRDHEAFSSAEKGFMMYDDEPWPLDMMRMVLLGMDPPVHTKHRGIVQKVFTPRRINQQEDQIRARVSGLLDGISERGECDFVSSIAVELPLQTITTMLGLPLQDRAKLFEWTHQLEVGINERSDAGLQAFGEIAQYLMAQVADRRVHPQQDLISAMVNAEVDGEQLNDLELTAFFAILMFAGNDTTRNSASGGLLALIENPDQRQILIDDPARIHDAVEEIIRWVTPVIHFRRTATKDIEIRGVPITAGQNTILWYPSGSRDEDLVDDPQRFDVTRSKIGHQAFGGGGRHFCLGSQLARLQLRVLLEELLQRMPDAELTGEVTRGRSNWVHTFTSLPIRFAPSEPRRL